MPYAFSSPLVSIESTQIIRLPTHISNQLPSRGMVMVEASIEGNVFYAPLEPDGKGGHWMRLDSAQQRQADVKPGDTVRLSIEPTKHWPEPSVPEDITAALESDQTALSVWRDITPMARWDWLRWIGSTANAATRQKRIMTTLSKLGAAKRRPCCFNRTQCSDPSVSRAGVLIGL